MLQSGLRTAVESGAVCDTSKQLALRRRRKAVQLAPGPVRLHQRNRVHTAPECNFVAPSTPAVLSPRKSLMDNILRVFSADVAPPSRNGYVCRKSTLPTRVARARALALSSACEIDFRAAKGLDAVAEEVAEAFEMVHEKTNFVKKFLIHHDVQGTQHFYRAEEMDVFVTCKALQWMCADQSLNTEVQASLKSLIVHQYGSRLKAETKMKMLSKTVAQHKRSRSETRLCGGLLSEDLVAYICEFIPLAEREPFVQTCREVSRLKSLRKLLPRLDIRHVLGKFPHFVGDDGTYFVAKNSVATAYVDFVVAGTRPVESEHNAGVVRAKSSRQQRDVALRKAPLPPLGSGVRHLLKHSDFFTSPIVCSVHLVDVDGNAVPGDDGDDAVKLCLESVSKNAPTSTFVCADDEPHPARISFKINKLSGPLKTKYRLKAVGVTTTPCGGVKRFVTLSSPIVVTAHKKTALDCAKRKQSGSVKSARIF